MGSPIRLNEAIDGFLASRKNRDIADGTLRMDEHTLLKFMALVGNIYPKSIGVHHIDMWLEANSTWAASTRVSRIGSLSAFQSWCQRRKLIPRDVDFLEEVRGLKAPKKRKPRVAPGRLDELLDEAPNPRDRVIVAIGVHLLIRASEMVPIQWKHVDANPGFVQVYRRKTGTYDDLPATGELEVEIEAWRRFVCVSMGVTVVNPDWYVVCKIARADRDERGHFAETQGTVGLNPNEPLMTPRLRVRNILEKVDAYEKGAGMHVLRRSGAVAMRDALLESDESKARITVQRQLGHASWSTTEGYLDDEADRNTRDQVLQGRFIYKKKHQGEGGRVIELKRAR